MSKLNKLVTNYPVSLSPEEVENLSLTLSAVETAGGGGGGKTYHGDNIYIGVDNINNTIRLLDDAVEKLNRTIPSAVSDLSDSANYATVESLTAYQAAGDYLSANALDALSGTWETVTDKLDTTAFSTVSGNFLTAHQSLTDYYTKLQTSGASELNTAFGNKQDNLTQEQLSAISSVSSIKGTILTGDSNIRATSAADGNNIKWTLELTAHPVVTDTTLSGYDGIVATKDSTINTQWNIGIAQAYKEQIEEVSSKLTKTEADTYYAPISVTGDVNTLKSSSGDWNKVSAKLDTSAFSSVSGKFISASQPFTANLGGGWSQSYLTVIDTTAVFNGYGSNSFSSISNNLIQGMSNSYTGGNNFAQGTSNTADGTSFAQGVTNYAKETSIAQGSVNTAINCSQAFGVGNSITDTGMAIGKYNKTSSDASFVIGNGTNSNRSDLFIIKHDGTVSSTGDFIVDGKSLSSVYNTVSTNSGDWLKESDLNYYVTSSDITTQDTDYVMTTTGWKVLTLPGGGMTQVIHDETLTGQGNDNNSKLGVAWSALSGNVSSKLDTTAAAQTYLDKTTYATDSATFVTSSSDTITGTKQYALTTAGWAEVSTPTIPDITANNGLSANGHTIGIDNTNLVADTQYAWTTTGWGEVSTPTIPAITAESGISADGYKIGLTTTAINAITSVSSKVDKPSSLVDKYLVLRTDSNGDVSGWCDFQDQSYSKSEALGTFVATANIDTTTLSGDGKSVSTKLGVKTDVIATKDYVNSSFLPTSGGTVSGEVIVSGGSTFDSQFLKITRENVNGYGRIGLGSSGPLALKVDDANQHTTQVNISPNNSNDQLVQVQHNGNTVGYLIPAVTSTTTAGLTNDGILHIILES